MERPDALVFDVNETLLDLSDLRPHFTQLFGSADFLGEWFARLLHGSLLANEIGPYRPFGVVGIEALMTMAKRRGLDLDRDKAAEVVSTIRRLSPHSDVARSLDRLRRSGLRLAALTNSSADAAVAQLNHAEIFGYFEKVISVEAVGRYKPAPEPYRYTLDLLNVEPGRALMVAAHDWDVIGARNVGMPGAFIERPGAVWGLPDPPPDIVVPDCEALADRLTIGFEFQ